MTGLTDHQAMRLAAGLASSFRESWFGPALAAVWDQLKTALGNESVDDVREALDALERNAARKDLRMGERLLADALAAGRSSATAMARGWVDSSHEGRPAIRHTLGDTGLAAVVWAAEDGSALEGGICLDVEDPRPVVDVSEILTTPRTADGRMPDADSLLATAADIDVASWFGTRRREVLVRAAAEYAGLGAADRAGLHGTEVSHVAARLAPDGKGGIDVVLLPCAAAPRTVHVAGGGDPVADVLGEGHPRPDASPVCWDAGDGACAICFYTLHEAHKRGFPANRALLNDVDGPAGMRPMPGRADDLICDVLYGDAVAVCWDLEQDMPRSLTSSQKRMVSTRLRDPASGVVAAEHVAAAARRPAAGMPSPAAGPAHTRPHAHPAPHKGAATQRHRVDRSRPHS